MWVIRFFSEFTVNSWLWEGKLGAVVLWIQQMEMRINLIWEIFFQSLSPPYFEFLRVFGRSGDGGDLTCHILEYCLTNSDNDSDNSVKPTEQEQCKINVDSNNKNDSSTSNNNLNLLPQGMIYMHMPYPLSLVY